MRPKDESKWSGKKCQRNHSTRGSKPKEAVIVTLNSSGGPQLKDALQHWQAKKGEQAEERFEVAAVCCQEHHESGEKWTDVQHAAKKLKWSLQGAEAVLGKGHSGCGGAAIATKRHIGLAAPDGRISCDLSPPPGSLLRPGLTGCSEVVCS